MWVGVGVHLPKSAHLVPNNIEELKLRSLIPEKRDCFILIRGRRFQISTCYRRTRLPSWRKWLPKLPSLRKVSSPWWIATGLASAPTRVRALAHCSDHRPARATVLSSDPADWRALGCAMPPPIPLHTSICKTITAGRVTSLKSLLVVPKLVKLAMSKNTGSVLPTGSATVLGIISLTKTIGNRKRDCAWGCARGINTTWENLQIVKHNSVR